VICFAISCQTVQIHSFPAPLSDCPTDEDVIELAVIFGPAISAATPEEAIQLSDLAGRFVDATAYCQTAEEKLSGN
jgi:hypothetical protein